MRCPICSQEGIHLGNHDLDEDLSLARHMYAEHDAEEISYEEHGRWARCSRMDPAPLGITNQEQLNAYCAGLGFPTAAQPTHERTSMSLATQICEALDGADTARDLDSYAKAAKDMFDSFDSRKNINCMLALYFYVNGAVPGIRQATITQLQDEVAEFINRHRAPKTAAFLSTLQR